jgi:hypothetical protein
VPCQRWRCERADHRSARRTGAQARRSSPGSAAHPGAGGHGHALPEGLALSAVSKAAHWCAAAGAAGVPANDVEPAAGDRVQRVALAGHGGHAGVARAAGIDEQRADPPTGVAGEVPDYRQGDSPAPGVCPVQRNSYSRAFELRPAGGQADRRGPRCGRGPPSTPSTQGLHAPSAPLRCPRRAIGPKTWAKEAKV